MFRLAYRKFGDHESVVGTYSVSSGGVAGVRWFELRNVTSGPVTVYQQSTYQPDTTWRWLGSAAMDGQGNLAIGFSASSSTINPQLRYAGRLATDPINTLGQGEAHLFDGTGSQSGSGNRWGDYASLTVDPVDDQTFWFTSEYYSTTATLCLEDEDRKFQARNRHADADPNTNSDADTHSDGYSHADADTNPHSDCDAHTYPDAFAYADGHSGWRVNRQRRAGRKFVALGIAPAPAGSTRTTVTIPMAGPVTCISA